MFASDNAGTIADAAVLAGRGNNNDGFGGNWWPLFFLFAMMGWGGYGMGGFVATSTFRWMCNKRLVHSTSSQRSPFASPARNPR